MVGEEEITSQDEFDGLEMPQSVMMYDAEKKVLKIIENGNITKEQKLRASEGISVWFDDLRDKIGRAWVRFKTSENVKGFMQELLKIWDKAMDALGKLWDELKIKGHNVAVDIETYLSKKKVDMQVETMRETFQEQASKIIEMSIAEENKLYENNLKLIDDSIGKLKQQISETEETLRMLKVEIEELSSQNPQNQNKLQELNAAKNTLENQLIVYRRSPAIWEEARQKEITRHKEHTQCLENAKSIDSHERKGIEADVHASIKSDLIRDIEEKAREKKHGFAERIREERSNKGRFSAIRQH